MFKKIPFHPLESQRVLLRAWREADLPEFARLNGDRTIMRHFARTYTREDSDKVAQSIIGDINEWGWGLLAAEEKASGRFMGFIGLQVTPAFLPFPQTVEIAWRLHSDFWGKGYATEGARLALQQGFNELALPEIIAITTTTNIPSQKVTQRIGMVQDHQAGFDHPRIPAGHELCRHNLYRLRREDYLKAQAPA